MQGVSIVGRGRLRLLATSFKIGRAAKEDDGEVEDVFACFEVRCEPVSEVLAGNCVKCRGEASGTLDAGEESGDDEGVCGEMDEFSEHFS